MPIRRRVALHLGTTLDPRLFLVGDGTADRKWNPRPVAPTREVARLAWGEVRRGAWAQCRRRTLPKAALIYDGLTSDGLAAMSSTWGARPFPIADVRAALASDRAAVRRFQCRDPVAADAIADYLGLWETDLKYFRWMAERLVTDSLAHGSNELLSGARYGASATGL